MGRLQIWVVLCVLAAGAAARELASERFGPHGRYANFAFTTTGYFWTPKWLARIASAFGLRVEFVLLFLHFWAYTTIVPATMLLSMTMLVLRFIEQDSAGRHDGHEFCRHKYGHCKHRMRWYNRDQWNGRDWCYNRERWYNRARLLCRICSQSCKSWSHNWNLLGSTSFTTSCMLRWKSCNARYKFVLFPIWWNQYRRFVWPKY